MVLCQVVRNWPVVFHVSQGTDGFFFRRRKSKSQGTHGFSFRRRKTKSQGTYGFFFRRRKPKSQGTHGHHLVIIFKREKKKIKISGNPWTSSNYHLLLLLWFYSREEENQHLAHEMIYPGWGWWEPEDISYSARVSNPEGFFVRFVFNCCLACILFTDDMENDAFILYVSTDQDRQFVVQTLIPKLEGQMCFTLCIHQRNFVSGLCKYVRVWY